ncbi:hypothetical protein [Streptomyces sp. NPDC000983]
MISATVVTAAVHRDSAAAVLSSSRTRSGCAEAVNRIRLLL